MENIIKARKKEFWGQERFHNISFSFQENEGDQKVLKANKTILALCSPVFEAMFFGDLAERRDPIPIVDVDYTIFEGFLRYIYTEEFHADSLEDAQNLFYVAHKYEVTCIESACELYMIHNIQKFDLSELISFADMFSMKNLMELCRLHMDHFPRPDLPAIWIKCKKGDALPPNTAFVDVDPTNNWPLGVGRFQHHGDLLPGTFNIKEKCVYAPYGGQSHKCEDDFEILCNGDLKWVESGNGVHEEKAVVGGRCNYHEELYVGKVTRENRPYIGKIHPSHRCLYIPYLTAELKVQDNYFILTDKHSKTERQNKPYFDYHPYDDDEGDDDDDGDVDEPRALPYPPRLPNLRARFLPMNLLNFSNSRKSN
uniref:CSON008583 protein n=1 Tax=Culicoides sonorensis TaxID=179676 RepID=A0A336M2N0_CULSO